MAQCVAHSSRTGQPCRNHAIAGGTVCRVHGGSLPRVKAAAQRRLAERRTEAQARRELARQGRITPPDVNPLTVLEETLNEVVFLKQRLSGIVSRLSDDSLRYEGKTGEQLRAELAVYRGLLQDVVKTAETLVRLDIAGRKQALDEHAATMVVWVIKAVLDDAGLTREQRQLANEAVPARLRQASQIEAAPGQPVNNPGDRLDRVRIQQTGRRSGRLLPKP